MAARRCEQCENCYRHVQSVHCSAAVKNCNNRHTESLMTCAKCKEVRYCVRMDTLSNLILIQILSLGFVNDHIGNRINSSANRNILSCQPSNGSAPKSKLRSTRLQNLVRKYLVIWRNLLLVLWSCGEIKGG